MSNPIDRGASQHQPVDPLKPGPTILEAESFQATNELQRPALGLFFSGLTAGFSAGIGVFMMAVLLTLAGGELSPLMLKLLLANAFTIGFIIVVLAHLDLFTEYTTIALLPMLTGNASVASVARLWGLVYLSNQVAAAGFALVAVTLGPALGIVEAHAFSELADSMTRHSNATMLMSSALAGWMMGLLSWLVSAGRDTISQIFFVWLITFSIGFLGLQHCVTGAIEVLAGILATDTVNLTDFFHFLGWTTLGNILGGVAFAVLIRYSVMVGERNKAHSRKGSGSTN